MTGYDDYQLMEQQRAEAARLAAQQAAFEAQQAALAMAAQYAQQQAMAAQYAQQQADIDFYGRG